MNQFSRSLSLFCTPEFDKATVILALTCVSAVAGLFYYLGHTTGRAHFRLWALSFMFYGVGLAGSIGFKIVPDEPIGAALLSSAMGVSALFMFWGDFELAERPRSRRELAWAVAVMVAWSVATAFCVGQSVWIVMPVAVLLGVSRIVAGFLYLRYLDRNHGTTLLVVAFLLWGLQALVFPFLQAWPWMLATVHMSSSLLALMIAMGMIVEEACKVTEEKYRGVLDSANEAIFLVDLLTLKLLDVNKAAQQLCKRSRKDLLGLSILDLCPDLRKAGNNQLDHRTMFNGVFKPYNEFHIARADGSLSPCEGETHLVQWHRRSVLQATVREINEDKKIGQMVRRAEKLSSLGQLIAGVAHELNNPLAVVVGYAQIMAKQKVGDEKVQGNMRKILHESERAAKIVRDLLTFARPCEPQMAVVDVNHLVSNVLEIRDADLRAAGVTVESKLSARMPRTKADPIQIEQVLTNLITNAIHAMAGQTKPRSLSVTTDDNGFFIRIIVADSGPGIAQEILSKIFDPFFTTKPAGKGTGLGLSISNSIMQEHRGKIWAQSEPGVGARFYVELPVVAIDAEAEAEPEPDDFSIGAEAGEPRLLIVDDEPGIRDVLKEALSVTGYKVETAADGHEAMERVSAGKFDLIISDLCMPQMDGEQLYEAVRDVNPRLAKRMIFVTGDTVSPKSRTFLEASGNRWLCKPFNIADVEETVQTLLAQDPISMLSGNGVKTNRKVGKYHPEPE